MALLLSESLDQPRGWREGLRWRRKAQGARQVLLIFHLLQSGLPQAPSHLETCFGFCSFCPGPSQVTLLRNHCALCSPSAVPSQVHKEPPSLPVTKQKVVQQQDTVHL